MMTVSSESSGDIVQEINGNFGRWQLRSIILVFLCKIPTAWFMACVIYTAPTPKKGDYYCRPAGAMQLNGSVSTNVSWVQMSQSLLKEGRETDREFLFDTCHIYEIDYGQNFVSDKFSQLGNPFQKPAPNATTLNIVPCDHFDHLNTEYKSLVTQFDLVCSRELLVSLTQSFHAIGTFLGGLLAILILNYFSPRRIMLIGMLGQIIFGNLTGLVSTFSLHIYCRCLTSIFCAFMCTAGQIILSDITSGKAKTIALTLSELFWSIGLILLPAISIFFDSWNYLYVAISSSLFILVFLHRWIADSPRWLLQHGKLDETLHLLLESAAFNNRDIPLNLEEQLEIYGKQLHMTQHSSYCSIWTIKSHRKYVISIHWASAVAMVLYNVMILMIRSLGVDHIHVNTACLGFAEMLGIFLGLYFILFTRHRWLWAGYLMLISGLLTYLIWLVPSSIKEARRVGFEMIFWILLKLANSASLSVLTICSGELVEQNQRTILMRSILTFSRSWLIVTPFISILTKIHVLIPITIFASLAISNGLLMCYLNLNFWNDKSKKVPKVPTPNTYRRRSTIILDKRRESWGGFVNTAMVPDMIQSGIENPNLSINHLCKKDSLTISISDLWQIDAACSQNSSSKKTKSLFKRSNSIGNIYT